MQFLCPLLLKCSRDLGFNLMAGISLKRCRNTKTEPQNSALHCFPKIISILTAISQSANAPQVGLLPVKCYAT